MFVLVRIHVPTTVHDKRTGVTATSIDRVWDHVVEEHKKWNTNDVRILYLTHRHLQEDTSLIIDAKNLDALADFLLTHIATMRNVRGIWVLPMTRMKLFEIPKGTADAFNRFTITVNAVPEHLDRIYENISSLKPGRDVVVNYIALTFQSFSAPLILCVLARSRNHVEYFVDHYIKPIEGVSDTETTYISKWMRLVSPEEWQGHVGHFIAPAGLEPIEDIEAEDDNLLSGC